MSINILPIKLGIRFDPPSLILLYKDVQTQKTRKRLMPMKDIDILTNINDLAKKLKEQDKYKFYLNKINDRRIEKCLFILQDHLKGYKLEESLERANEQHIKNNIANDKNIEDVEEFEDNDYYDFYKRNDNNKNKVETNDSDDYNDNSF